jgi:sulfur carrier protein
MNTDGSTTIEVVVNGDARTIPGGLTLLELLGFLELDPTRLAVELDRAIVRKSAWPATPVSAGAHLEIVQFVGGG